MASRAAARRALVRAASSPTPRRVVAVTAADRAIDGFAAFSRRRRTRGYREFLDFHAALLAHTDLAGQEGDIAERAVAELWKMVERFWRPWLLERGVLEGGEHLEAARRQGRGVVLSFPHFGMPYAQFHVLRRYGIDAWVIAAPHHFESFGDGYHGRFQRQGRSYVDLLGPGHAIVQPGAFASASRLLERGEIVSVAFDSVGSMPTPFLGRTVSLASGSAALAHRSGAVVVPFVIRPRGRTVSMCCAPAIDPRDFADAVALQARIARQIEAWALERPHAVWRLETQPGGPPLVGGDAGLETLRAA